MKEYNVINAYCGDLDHSADQASVALGTESPKLQRIEWRPAPWRIFPLVMATHIRSASAFVRFHHLVYWWLWSCFRRWPGKRYYSISLVLDHGCLVHYAVTRSRDFRFPFMDALDLQIGPVWTDPQYRSSGLSTKTIQAIFASAMRNGWRRLWWLCRDDNVPSNCIAHRAGFEPCGSATRTNSLLPHVFGVYRLCGQMQFGSVTELPGQRATADQQAMRQARYALAASYADRKDVLEIACGSGMGLGFLASSAKRVVGADIDRENCRIASTTYRNDPRVNIIQCDGHTIPFTNSSFDLVLLFEALYYFKNPGAFISEVRRVLRPGGLLVISSVNCDWQGFNPSPFSTRYYNASDLRETLALQGFHVAVLVGFPDRGSNFVGKAVRIARTVAVKLNLIPKTMRGKEWLKRVFYGEMKPMRPDDIAYSSQPTLLLPLEQIADLTSHRMLYAVASAPETGTCDR